MNSHRRRSAGYHVVVAGFFCEAITSFKNEIASSKEPPRNDKHAAELRGIDP